MRRNDSVAWIQHTRMLNIYFSCIPRFGEELTEHGRVLDLNLDELGNEYSFVSSNVPLKILDQACYTLLEVRNDQLENFTHISNYCITFFIWIQGYFEHHTFSHLQLVYLISTFWTYISDCLLLQYICMNFI